MSKNGKKKRKHLNTNLHEKIKKKYDKCAYCGEYLEEKDRTVDHVKPISKGGLDIEENIVVACATCNTNKNDYDLEEFLRLMEEGYFDRDVVLKRLQSKIYSPIVNSIKNDIVLVDKVVSISDVLIPLKFTEPKKGTIKSRKDYFVKYGEFKKTAIAEEKKMRNGRTVYILRQGYVNYIILKELGETQIHIRAYERKGNC